jgi:phosphonate transport system substrate-binding protein
MWCAYGLAAGWLVWAAYPFAAAGSAPASDDASPGLRIAVSESVAGEVNDNDLRAAIKTWAEAVARQTGVRIDAELCTSGQLVQRVRNRQVDAFSTNVLEFARVAGYADHELVVDETQFPDGEEYVLLVHQSGGIRSLADLRGRTLLLDRSTRACLAGIWLDTLLGSAHLGAMDTFLGRLESSPKLSRVVLPVFFRQTDACLVTRRGYDTMCDLNPQLAKQLHPLAVSPKLVTTFLAFHKDSPAETRRRFLAAVTDLHKTVAGRQALMLFGSTRLVPADVAVLRTSFELLHAYERLQGKAPAAGQ